MTLLLHRIAMLTGATVLAATLLGASCQTRPTPDPNGTGGTPIVDPWTGGSGGQGGQDAGTAYDRCVAAKTVDPVTRNVAQETGTQLSVLVRRVCSDQVIQEAY